MPIADLAVLNQFLDAAPDAMVLVDSHGIMQQANQQATALFQAPLIGKAIESLVPRGARERHIKHRSDYESTPRVRPMGAGLQLEGVKGDGTQFPVAISLSPITVAGQRFTLAAVRDVTDQRRQETTLRENLDQKEMLLKEVHHRVKNNLQIIVSLLSMQARATPDLAEEFREAKGRIRSMALVHERLYQATSVGFVNVSEYLHALVKDLGRGVGGARIVLEAADDKVDPDTAITLGLIVNEVVSNARKHGLKKRGTLKLEVDTRSGISLVAQDDGPGMPSEMDLEATSGIGVRLIRALAQQLGATATWTTDHGTRVEIKTDSPADSPPAEPS